MITCFKWIFKNKPKQYSYFYCDTKEQCQRLIEKMYGKCEYEILEKQVRSESDNSILSISLFY